MDDDAHRFSLFMLTLFAIWFMNFFSVSGIYKDLRELRLELKSIEKTLEEIKKNNS